VSCRELLYEVGEREELAGKESVVNPSSPAAVRDQTRKFSHR